MCADISIETMRRGLLTVFLIFLTVFTFSCVEKGRDIKAYEKKTPYPGADISEPYAKGSLLTVRMWADLYGENRASKPGDLIFIKVVESLSAIESISNDISRNTQFSNTISAFFGVPQSTLANLGSDVEGELSAAAESGLQQRGVLTTRLAGRVIKVYPNGSMLIRASKNIHVNGLTREFILMGIIRPEDIDSSNTVPSDRIANMEIYLDGKGYLADGGKPGWLARILAKIFPF
jgi:flagellar L-ring protein precursor FlgH